MSDFEFVFSLFGLMLGFSLAEVLGGFIRTIKARRHVRLGWLTPMLAIFVMLDLTSFWANAWDHRAAIPATYGVMVLGLAASGLYYFLASLIFPERPEECPDLDEHFYLRRRPILTGVAACALIVIAVMAAVGSRQVLSVDGLVTQGFYFVMIALAAWPRKRWLNITALALLIFLYAFFALASLILGASPTPN
jgi:hypothetical protein